MKTDTKEIMSIMMRMRILIKREFGTTPSLREVDSAIRYYHLGAKSQQPELLQFAKQLGALLSIPTAEAVAAIAVSTAPVPQPAFREQTPISRPIAHPVTQPAVHSIAQPVAQTIAQTHEDSPQQATRYQKEESFELARSELRRIAPKEIE